MRQLEHVQWGFARKVEEKGQQVWYVKNVKSRKCWKWKLWWNSEVGFHVEDRRFELMDPHCTSSIKVWTNVPKLSFPKKPVTWWNFQISCCPLESWSEILKMELLWCLMHTLQRLVWKRRRSSHAGRLEDHKSKQRDLIWHSQQSEFLPAVEWIILIMSEYWNTQLLATEAARWASLCMYLICSILLFGTYQAGVRG